MIEIPKAYANRPPVIAERLEELAESDLVDAPRDARPSRPPPPPAPKRRTAPPLALVVPQPMAPSRALSAALTIRAGTVPMPVAGIRVLASPIPEASAPPASSSAPEAACAEEAPPPSSVVSKEERESTIDPMDLLFDGVYELNFVDTLAEAGAVCALALARALRARAVVVHAHDLAARTLSTIGVAGAAAGGVLGSSASSDEDLVGAAVVCNESPVTMRFDGELPRRSPARLAALGAPRTLVAVPAMAWGRCVAMIEILDADERVADRVASAAAYVAEHLAEFVSERAAA